MEEWKLTPMQCITMGALLNQSMFLILIGLMKGKTVALIVQDFRNVSSPTIKAFDLER
jgi:hypothetical protein